MMNELNDKIDREVWFRKSGFKGCKERFDVLVELYNKLPQIKYPRYARIFGFPLLILRDRQEHFDRITELGEILGLVQKGREDL